MRDLILEDLEIDDVTDRVRVMRSTFTAPDDSSDSTISSQGTGGRVIAIFGKRTSK